MKPFFSNIYEKARFGESLSKSGFAVLISDLVCDQGVMLRDSLQRLLFASALIKPEYCVVPKYLKGHMVTHECLTL